MMVFDICQTLVENMKDYSEPQKEYFEKNDMKSSSMWDKMKEEQKKKGNLILVERFFKIVMSRRITEEFFINIRVFSI